MIRVVPGFALMVLLAVSNIGPAQFAVSWSESGSVQAAQHVYGAGAIEEPPETRDEQQRRRDGNDSAGIAAESCAFAPSTVRGGRLINLLEAAPASRFFELAPIRGPPRV